MRITIAQDTKKVALGLQGARSTAKNHTDMGSERLEITQHFLFTFQLCSQIAQGRFQSHGDVALRDVVTGMVGWVGVGPRDL